MTRYTTTRSLGILFMASLSCCRPDYPPDKIRLDPIRGSFAYPESAPKVMERGRRIGIPAEPSKLVIAKGNGITGYQSVEIDRENRMEVRIFHPDNRRKVYAFETTFTGIPLIDQLLGVHPVDSIYEHYSTELHGGTGAFLILFGSDGSKHVSSMNNYYPGAIRDLWTAVRSLVESIPRDNWMFVGKFSSLDIESHITR